MAGIDLNTVLMLHGNGPDAGTAFPDSSFSDKIVTAFGNAQIDTSQFIFGGSSILLDGTGDYLSIPDSPHWDYGTGDFAMEAQVRHAVVGDQIYVNSQGGFGADGGGIGVGLGYDGAGSLYSGINGNNYLFTWTPLVNTWYHVFMSRDGGQLRAFINGIQIGSTQTSTENVTGGTEVVYIGRRNNNSRLFNGWIQEVRITKGFSRHTSDFAAPTEAYTGDSEFRPNIMRPRVFAPGLAR
jgi:hypothetical protein